MDELRRRSGSHAPTSTDWRDLAASLMLDFLTDYYASQAATDVLYPLPLVLNEFVLPLRAAA
ncbi:hypothetical protein ACQCLI_12925 [Pseudomonas nitroreducens]|uniref:hypothetical protein n=1 Tax=Pseudomonas nitroreducens TaxID=46680 RepID=UPI0012FD763C|nr:hypothetical protein [Pseudomonas nitroreducens]